MADVGLEFNSDSFKVFNQTLKEFNKITASVDKKLVSVASTMEKLLSTVDTSNIRNFGVFEQSFSRFIAVSKQLSVNNMTKLQTSINQLLKSTSAYGVLQFEQFIDAFNKFGIAFKTISTGDIVTTANSLKNFFKTLETFKPKQSTVVIVELNYFFEQLSGIINRISKVGAGNTSMFLRLATSIRTIVATMNDVKSINISVSDIDNLSLVFTKFQEIFTGGVGIRNSFKDFKSWFTGGLNIIDTLRNIGSLPLGQLKDFAGGIKMFVEAFELIGKLDMSKMNLKDFSQQFRELMSVFTGATGLKGFGQRIAGFFTGRLGIVNVINSLGTIRIANFGDFANGMKDLISALNAYTTQRINVADVKANNAALQEFMKVFTGGSDIFSKIFRPLDLLLGRGGILNILGQFDSKYIEGFKSFGRGVRALTDSFAYISRSRIDKGSIRNFSESVGYLINQLTKAFKGGIFGTGFLSSRTKDLKIIEETLTVLERLSKIKIDVKNIEEALSLPGLKTSLTKTGEQGANALIASFKRKLRIASPSRVFQVFGVNIVQGLQQGIKNLGQVFTSALSKLTSMFKSVKDKITNFIDARKASRELKMLEREAKHSTSRIGGFFQSLRDKIVLSIDIGDLGAMADRLWDAISPNSLMEQFIEFESAFTGVVKTLDTSGMSDTEAAQFISNLQDDIRAMASAEGGVLSGLENAQVTIAGIMESAGQLGVASEDLKEFTETVGAMSLATNLSTEDAANFFGQFGAITNSDEFDKIGATIVGLGNKSSATESQIADFALRLAGAGTAAGLTEAEILGIGTAMAGVGINAEAGGTAMTEVFNTMSKAAAMGGKDLNNFAEIAGVSADQFATMWSEDTAGALDLFVQGLGKLDNAARIQALDELGLDGARVSDVLTRLGVSGDSLTEAIRIANEEWEKNSALMEEAQKRAATTRSAVNRMKNTFFDLKITIGEILQPVYLGFVNTITTGVRVFNEWLKSNKEAISEIFPKIKKFFDNITKTVKTFFTLFKNMPLKSFAQAMDDIGRAFRFLFSGNSQAGIYMFKMFFENIKTGIKDTFTALRFALGDWSTGGENPIFKTINGLFTAIKTQNWDDAKTIVVNSIRGIFTSAINLLGLGEGGVFGIENEGVAGLLRDRFDDLSDPKNFTEAVDKVVVGIRLALYDIGKGDFSGVKTFIKDHIAQIVRSALGLIVSAVFGFPVGTLFSLANLIIGAIESDFLGIRGFLEQSTIGQAIIGLADGINKLIEDAFAGLFGDGKEEDPMADAMLRHLGYDPRGGQNTNIIDKIKTAIFGSETFSLDDFPIIGVIQDFFDSITDLADQISQIDIEPLKAFFNDFFVIIGGTVSGAIVTSVLILQNIVIPIISNAFAQIEKIIANLSPERMGILAAGFAIFKGVIGSFIGFVAPLIGVFALIGGVANSIGDFALALGDVFDVIENLSKGDIIAAANSMTSFVVNLWNGVKNFVEGAVQPFIDLINSLLNLAGIDFQLISVEQAFQTLEMVAQGVLINIMRWVEDLGFKLAYQFNDIKIRGLQALKDTGLATGDQLLQLDQATIERNALNAVTSIQDAVFNAASRRDGLDLSSAITFENWDGTQFQGSIEEALNNPEIVNRLSGSTKTLLLNAAKNALKSGDGKEIADALNVFRALGEIAPELPAGTQQIIATSLSEYKKLIEMEYDNVVLELPTLQQLLMQASFDQAMGGSTQFQIPEGMGVEFATQFSASLTAAFQSNPLDLAGIFNANTMLNNNSEILAKAGVDMAAALRESVANAFTTGLEATGDAEWAAGSVLDEFLPLLNLSGSQDEIQTQFNEQLALLTQNLNAEDALAIGQALEIKLEEIILAGTGATIDLQVDKEAIDAAGAEAMKQNGLDVIGGLLAGVGEMLGIDTLTTEAEKVFTSFNDAFKTAAGISSPSQVFIDNGKALVDGLNQGVTEQMPIYQQTMTMMADEITKFKDHTNLQIEEFKTILTGIPLAILDTGLQFTNAVMIWAVQGLIFGVILDTMALKIAGVADQLSNLAAFLGLVGGTLGGLQIPGGKSEDGDGLAMGGDVRRGKIYEVLENNLPFEMFKTKGRTYFISNSDGTMLSPLAANAIGANNVSNNTTNNTSGDVVMNFNINSNDPEEIVRIAKREFKNEKQKDARNYTRQSRRSGVYGD